MLEADDYCSNSNTKATRRVLLLNRVITGKEFNTKLNSSHLVRPPTGYHSVRSYDLDFNAMMQLLFIGRWQTRRSS